MNKRFTLKRRSVFIGLALLVALAVLAVFFWPGPDSSNKAPADSGWAKAIPTISVPPAVADKPVDIGIPTKLIVDKMEVSAPVIPLGFADDGSQAVPKSLSETGWWELGSRPGQAGNGVIVGHATSRGKGVFNGLDELAVGDEIVVEGKTGKATFSVTKVEKKPKVDFAEVADDVYRTTGAPGLVLMTCGGWNGEVHEDIIFAYADMLAS